MKYISLAVLLFTALISCSKSKRDQKEYNKLEDFSAYKVILEFSNRIKPDTGLILCCYASNQHLPKDYIYKNEVASISADFKIFKTQKDLISIDEARKLIISLEESFLKEINSNQEILSDLETYPFTRDLVDVGIYFIDENQIDLGQGISEVRFLNGKITYKSYEIYEYTGKYPANGRHFKVYEETYEEALDIVNQRGELLYF